MKSGKLVLLVTGGLACVALPGAAHAQGSANPYEVCSKIGDDARRLACFDATYAKEVSLAETRAQEREERAIAQEQREVDNFGFTQAQVEEREKAEREERRAEAVAAGQPTAEMDREERLVERADPRVASSVAEVWTDQRRKYVLLLANGQIWRANSEGNYRGSIRPGWNVEIKKGKIGGFRLHVEGKTGFLGVDRVR